MPSNAGRPGPIVPADDEGFEIDSILEQASALLCIYDLKITKLAVLMKNPNKRYMELSREDTRRGSGRDSSHCGKCERGRTQSNLPHLNSKKESQN